MSGKNAGAVRHQFVFKTRLQVGDDDTGSNDTSLGWIVNRAADGARRGVLCKYNSEEKGKGAQQNEVGSQAHDAVAREILRNVSQGEWQMQLRRGVLVNSDEVKIPEGKRVARRVPIANEMYQYLSTSVCQ